MNEAYVRTFKSDPPARATIGSQLMSADNLLEIAVIAVK
jgi:enamine deaminase RidA (YjgF/YER057c/UK114 family)